jgi:hypothetical protein
VASQGWVTDETPNLKNQGYDDKEFHKNLLAVKNLGLRLV